MDDMTVPQKRSQNISITSWWLQDIIPCVLADGTNCSVAFTVIKERFKRLTQSNDFPIFLSLSLSLQCNSTLLSLGLSGNKIENRGAMHLASMLQVNDTLKELELADCDLVNTHTDSCDLMLIFLGSARLLVVLVSQLDFKRQTEAGLSDLPLSLQATQSVIAFAIMLKSNSSLHSVDISRPLLFSHQVQTHSITVVYYINMIQIEHLSWTGV